MARPVIVLSDSGLSVFCLVLCLEVGQVKIVVLCIVLKWIRSGKLSCALSSNGSDQKNSFVGSGQVRSQGVIRPKLFTQILQMSIRRVLVSAPPWENFLNYDNFGLGGVVSEVGHRGIMIILIWVVWVGQSAKGPF